MCVICLFDAILVFFGCLFVFLYIFLYFDGNQQINNAMKFQEASCSSLAVSVLSSSVEPPSQSLAVPVS